MQINSLSKIVVPSHIIPATTNFIRQQGLKGLEGRVYWIGSREGEKASLTRIAIPEQIATKSIYGVSVTVPQEANINVSRSLSGSEYIVAKVHSHPQQAYNSQTDKSNPFLRHEGSISIIVADFGRNGMNALANCAVCVFKNSNWVDLTRRQIIDLFEFQ